MKPPLSGIRVLDLSQAQSGPYGSMLLGDLGAEVIKIESPEGDMSRSFAGPTHKEQTYYFLTFNRNKKSIVLDLGTPGGKETFHDLVKVSDVVWDNFRPGVMEKIGADYNTLKNLNPHIISCSITGYGSSGPYHDYPSYDIIAQGMSGLLSLTGEPEGQPVKPAPALADISSGMFGAMGVIAALAARERTGDGQRIEVNLLDAALALMAYHFSFYFCGGGVPQPAGGGHLSLLPFGIYPTKEGYITIGISWPRIARVVGGDWMIDDPRFAEQNERLKHRKEFETAFIECLSRATAEDWLELFRAEDIPAGPVYTLDKATTDPQVLHNKMVLSMEHPLGSEIRLIGNPVKMPHSIREEEFTPPPPLGYHTQEIMRELLGYTEERIKYIQEESERHIPELRQHIHKRR